MTTKFEQIDWTISDADVNVYRDLAGVDTADMTTEQLIVFMKFYPLNEMMTEDEAQALLVKHGLV